MSLPAFDTQGSLFTSVQCVAPALFGETDRYLIFAQKIWPLLAGARGELAKCYCENNGRAGVEPVVLLGVAILQFMERLPDRQAAEAFKYHLGWKLALGVPVDAPGFHPTTLVYFRERLLAHEQAQLAFEVVLEGLSEAGLIAKRTRQRMDSTHVLGLVARLSRLECARETMRLALQEIGEGGSEAARPASWGVWWERYVEHKLDYKSPDKLLRSKLVQTGEDIWALLEWVKTQSEGVAQGRQVALLRRVFEEQFALEPGPDEAGGKPPSAGNIEVLRAPPPGAVQNPHDAQALWSAKSNGEGKKEWVGYKVQVAESLGQKTPQKGEPTGHFLTAVETQEAIGSEKAGMAQVLSAQSEAGLEKPGELLVDAGYVSAATLAQAQEEGRELVGPAQPSPTNQSEGFRAEDFDVNIAERRAVCPAGRASTQCSRLEEGKSGEVSFRFEFGRQCHTCELRERCVGKGQRHRTVTVGQYHALLQARRREQKTEAFQKRMHARNGIEGTHSELVRAHGLRRARYRGLAKVTLQNLFIGAACNVKRWLRLLAWEMRNATAAVVSAAQNGVTTENNPLAA